DKEKPSTVVDQKVMNRAKELAQQVLIVDTHIDVPYRLREKWEDISRRTKEGHFDYLRAKEGGLDAAFMSIYIPASYQQTGGAKALADTLIDMVNKFASNWPDKFAMATSVEDVRQNFKEGKISLLMGMENGAGIEDKLENLEYFYKRGIRYITLTHAKNNLICDSSYDTTRHWNGLSKFGEKVVAEMNRLGIMVDISHVSDSTFYQVLEITQAPVIASHSGCRYFTPGWERNMSDNMIRLLAENDGVIQINFGSAFLKSEYLENAKKFRKEMDQYLKDHNLKWADDATIEHAKELKKKYMMGTVSDIVAHINRVVELVGIDHVGVGSDFDGVSFLPQGMEDVSKYPNLIYELLKKGYSEEDIEKICSGNILRVMSDVEKISQHLRAM
ncbi:MAG: dipeptidase, partial [Calditrichia bacterium]